MPLVDDVKLVCDRLAPLGWRSLLMQVSGNQLDIKQATPAALRTQLAKTLTAIDRNVAGFSDFSLDGKRGITHDAIVVDFEGGKIKTWHEYFDLGNSVDANP